MVPGTQHCRALATVKRQNWRKSRERGCASKRYIPDFLIKKKNAEQKERTWWLVYAGCGGRGDLRTKRFG